MRGTQDPGRQTGSLPRIIPADAGNTEHCGLRPYGTPDHPRGCGEHQGSPRIRRSTRGSSPRMRGTLPGPVRVGHRRRIIPADAGNTACTWAWTPVPRDHPRGCGEHHCSVRLLLHHSGSSPRMRGTPLSRTDVSITVRIIPADAGKTDRPDGAKGITRDHPRGCGEHSARK